MKGFVIAIDGHAGAGKGTIAQDLVERLPGALHLDSGALYRAWAARFASHDDPVSVARAHTLEDLEKIDLCLRPADGKPALVPCLEGKLLGDPELRNVRVTGIVPHIAQVPDIRIHVSNLQRRARSEFKLVVDGRDIGTEIFPDAEVKLFVTASLQARAWRRHEQLITQGGEDVPPLDKIMAEISQRDHLDETRKKSPLRRHPEAVAIDTTHLSREAQFQEALRYVRAKLGDSMTL